MDIQYKNNNEFFIEITQNNSPQQAKFFEKEMDFYNLEDAIVIKENVVTKLLFTCEDSNAKLYMDGIETLNNDIAKEDIDGQVYIEPSNNLIDLYTVDNFPLIPGTFRMIVEIHNKKFYSKMKVEPKLFTEKELEVVKEDLEEEINGLAFELIKKNISIGEVFIEDLPIDLYKFLIIENKFFSVMAALEDLKIKPNYKIKKIYKTVREDEVKSIDEITIRNHLEGNLEEGFLKQPTIELDYDLPENQWIKKIVIEIGIFLKEFIEVSENFVYKKKINIKKLKRYKNNENKIKDEERTIEYVINLMDLARKMKNAINILNSVEWFKSVSNRIGINLPHTLFFDSRYNLIYKLYQQLKGNDFTITLDNKFAFQWKRTDKLYEMWCFVKISRIIIGEKLGFRIDSGWLFNQTIESNKVLIPELESSTRLSFKKDDIYMNLTYDDSIPNYSSETSIYNTPLYITSSNRQPDGRIDVYKRDVYIGSIILEFKYRDRKGLWAVNYTRYQREMNSNVIKQLTAYGDNCSTRYLFIKEGEKGSKYKNSIRPVMRVLIFYPKRTDVDIEIDEVEDHNLKFVRFTPEVLKNAEESLELSILELLERVEEYGIN